MIHIVRSANGKYDVIEMARNGKVLSETNQGFNRKQGCWVNIKARGKHWGKRTTCRVQDDTLKEPVIFYLLAEGEVVRSNLKPQQVYVSARKRKSQK